MTVEAAFYYSDRAESDDSLQKPTWGGDAPTLTTADDPLATLLEPPRRQCIRIGANLPRRTVLF